MFARILGGLALAIGLTLGLELVHGLHASWPEALARLGELELPLLGVSALLVWAIIVLLHAITNRFWAAAAIVTTLATLIGAADFLKMSFRDEPLFLADVAYLSEVAFLIENVGAGAALALAAVLLAVPLLAWFVARSVRNSRRRRAPEPSAAPTSGRRSALLRMASGATAFLVIFGASTFNSAGSPARALYEAAGARWAPWNQSQNYDDNGLIAGLLYTLPAAAMDEPEGYSPASVAAVVGKYEEAARELNAGRDPRALEGVNVVTVLSESLADPLALPGIEAAEDPMPFLRELMESNPSGTMISSGFGGGTANVEFEVLTGMAVANFHAQVDSPFQALVADAESFPSHLTWLVGDGAGGEGGEEAREGSAIHPYYARFYRRNAVYPALGFERASFWDSGLAHLTKLPGDRHVSDASLFGEVVRELRRSEAPLFVNAVSMQNHSPQQGLANPIPVTGPLTDAEADSAAQYTRGVKHSDEALEEFVAELAGMDERTVVVLYGDHLPSFWSTSLLDSAGPLARYQTPWVVFANFPLEDGAGPEVLGANQLMNQVVD
ncbi:MAG: LTA synthase family protein, partial [bacterium]|nr:LTA synthase family protein [bacterium]